MFLSIYAQNMFFGRKDGNKGGTLNNVFRNNLEVIIYYSNNGWKLFTIITKHFILDVAAALDPPLELVQGEQQSQ